jgi:uncharacterized membrane protein YheB (UPF0754 family)
MNVAEFKKYLQIDKHALDECVMQQPHLFFQVSEAFMQAAAKRDALKEELAVVDAKLDAEVREDLEKSDIKITEAKVKSNIGTDKRHEAAFRKYIAAKEHADVLMALKDAFQQRSYMLRDMVQLYATNYFEDSSMSSRDLTRDKVEYTRQRERLATAREARDK